MTYTLTKSNTKKYKKNKIKYQKILLIDIAY